MNWFRSASAGECLLAIAVTACAPSDGYVVVCDDALPDRELNGKDCDRTAAAAVADLGTTELVEAIVVVAYRGCPPGAFCALVQDPPPVETVSALIGIRLGDGASVLRHVVDMDAFPGVAIEPIGGYDPVDFIDRYLPTASRSSESFSQ